MELAQGRKVVSRECAEGSKKVNRGRSGISTLIAIAVAAVVIMGGAVAVYAAYGMGRSSVIPSGSGGLNGGAATATTAETNRVGTATATTTGVGVQTSTASQLPPGTISIADALGLMRVQLAGADVNRSADTITFSSQNISIVAFAMMPENATVITGTQPPAHSTDDVFVIGSLINPTLVIPRGASVHFSVVNLDGDMYHDLVVSALSPPYPYMAMQGMMWGAGGSFLYMMPILSPANYQSGWAPMYSYTVTIPSVAALWYLCTYPGHAQSGMYGEIITR